LSLSYIQSLNHWFYRRGPQTCNFTELRWYQRGFKFQL